MPKATGIVIPFLQNQRVVCKGKVEKTGVVQGAMVVCDCCQESFAPSAFEKHSGGTWHRPWQYIFVIETERNILYYRNQYEGRDPESSDDPAFPVLSSKDPKEREKEEMTLKDVVPQKKMKRNTCWSTDDSDIENTWVSDHKKVKVEPCSPESSPFWQSSSSRRSSKKSYDESKEDQELEVALKEKYNQITKASSTTTPIPSSSCPSTPCVPPTTQPTAGDHSNLASCPTSPEFFNVPQWSAPKPCDFATALHKLVQEDIQMLQEINLYAGQSDFQFANNSGLCDFTESFLSSWNDNDNDNVQSLLL